MRTFTVEQRRARLGHRHALAARAGSVADAADAMVVLHATDPATVFLSAAARIAEPSIEAVEHALYEERSVVRLLAMRRTLFVASRAILPSVEHSSARRVAATERKRLLRFLSESGAINDPEAWLDDIANDVESALDVDGTPAREVTKRVPVLATKIEMGRGTKHAVTAGATSRVLGLMAAEGRLVRGRPTGPWTGRQYRWHRRADWLGSHEATTDAPTEADASSALVQQWLHTFGPASFDDLKWWTGWTVKQTRTALENCGAVEVDMDGEPAILASDDVDPDPAPDPWVALLPALDPTPMGWKRRQWYLGDHHAALFDRSGNIGPTVWVDGRIVGGWAQRPDGEVLTEILEDVGSDCRERIAPAASELTELLRGTVIKPSFPTPLLREMVAR